MTQVSSTWIARDYVSFATLALQPILEEFNYHNRFVGILFLELLYGGIDTEVHNFGPLAAQYPEHAPGCHISMERTPVFYDLSTTVIAGKRLCKSNTSCL